MAGGLESIYEQMLGDVPDEVVSLFALVLVEWHGADQQMGAYAYGRRGGYTLVMDAMVTRWPVLEELKRRMTEQMG